MRKLVLLFICALIFSKVIYSQTDKVIVECPKRVLRVLKKEFNSCLKDSTKIGYVKYSNNNDTIRIAGYIINRSTDSSSVPEIVLKSSTEVIDIGNYYIPIKSKSEIGKVDFVISHPNFVVIFIVSKSSCKILELYHYF